MDRCKWRKVIKEARWSWWVWVGECFFWYRPTRVVPDQRPLNGRCCCCCSFITDDSLSYCIFLWQFSPVGCVIKKLAAISQKVSFEDQGLYISQFLEVFFSVVCICYSLCVFIKWVCVTDICTASDGEQKLSSGGLDSLEALGKTVLQQSLAGVTTVADWKTQPSAVTSVTSLHLLCDIRHTCTTHPSTNRAWCSWWWWM